MNTTLFARVAGALLAAIGLSSAFAQNAAPNSLEAAFEASKSVAKIGPATVALAGQANLKVPEGYVFIPQPNAHQILVAMGNPGRDTSLHGLVFPRGDGNWFMTVNFEKSGYIKDDDAKDWNANELLDSIKSGTEASNKERLKMGIPAIEVVGWAEKPAYDAGTHRLVWAMAAKDRDAPASAPQGVNYNTYALGREGYFSLNLVTDLKDLDGQKSVAKTMLGALDFNDGKRYADFNSATDHVAEYGLAALVAGGAAKKLGVFAAIGAFLAKFAKVILLGLAAFGGALFKFFGGKKEAA
jgi:uncharacterized membrane-anchored protein